VDGGNLVPTRIRPRCIQHPLAAPSRLVIRTNNRRLAAQLLAISALLCSATPTLLAQGDIIRTTATWRSFQTRFFDVHYPVDAELWARDLAPRLDAIHDAVKALAGYAPSERTTIVIDDPYNVPNGSAIPLLGQPTVYLWATPPTPTDQIANHRGWGVKLISHEFGHIAHLTRPARRSQWFWDLLPARVSPLALGTPRWATEGYATWIEGKVTGSGRPHGAWRPALLRELALAGRLPSYGAMSGVGGYKGGSMAYLAGSAFWEWLAAQRGDTSMTLVFRRQTARVARSFDEAFRGVYGDAPAVLYGRFAAELTVKSFAAESLLRSGAQDTRLARFSSSVSAAALSRDGARLALALPGQQGGPSRIIVTVPDTEPPPKELVAQRATMLTRDPQDVAAIAVYPRLAKALHTLSATRGRFYGNPRFIDAAGTRVLLESWGRVRDGSQRPDLAVWNTADNSVTQITHGATVQDADPAPDGSRAAAVRCIGGVCDLVLVSLTDGTVTVAARGSPTTVFNQPRWSPDGRQLVTGVQDSSGTWRLAMVDVSTGALTIVTPLDDINRYAAGFDQTGAVLTYVSEAGGVPNAEQLNLVTRERTQRTSVAGSVYWPQALPNGGVLYLSEYAGGMDLLRTESTSIPIPPLSSAATARLAPALPRAREAGVPLARSEVAASTPYVLGPRRYRLLAQTALARDGMVHSGVISSADPANRFIWTLAGMAGNKAAWRGGVASAAWYGSRPQVRTELFWLEQRASAQGGASLLDAPDLRIAGASIGAELPIAGSPTSQRMGVSAFTGRAQQRGFAAKQRSVVTAQYAIGSVVGWRATSGVSLRAAAGALGDSSFLRGTASAYLSLRGTRVDLYAHRATQGTPAQEQFRAGGFPPPLSDGATLAQRVAIPALPFGTVRGTTLYQTRLERPAFWLPANLVVQSVGTSARVDRQTALVALERGVDFGFLGLVGLPRLHALVGAAHIFRGPLRNKQSAYFTIGWRP
jgi:hypothetical protein